MDGMQLGRRKAVSGGLAAARLACITAPSMAQDVCEAALGQQRALASGAALMEYCRGAAHATGPSAGESAGRIEPVKIKAAVERARAALHAPFRAEFLAWLGEADRRFDLPLTVDLSSPCHTALQFAGVHRAIWVSLGQNWSIDVGVEWAEVCWDLLTSEDVMPERVPGGWRNALLIPEAQRIHSSKEAIWRADGFDALAAWVNGTLARATHLAMWGCGKGSTWAELVQDGALMRRGRLLSGVTPPEHLLPVHGQA